MPELPEVEFSKKRCAQVLRDTKILRVTVAQDPIVMDADSPAAIQNALQGQRVQALHRHGKYFWWELSSGLSLLLHLGMTGAIHLPGQDSLELSHRVHFDPATWPPKFVKFELQLENGQRLAFCDPRRFARIRLQQDPRHQAPLCHLGFDPIHNPPGRDEFVALLQKRRGNLKALLLNQRFIAGIGNWIADEILYQSGVDPRVQACECSRTQSERIYQSMRSIIEYAVQVDADKSRFPADWLFHRRWGKKTGTRTLAGDLIEYIECGGRSTAWVPARQGDTPL